MNRESRPGGSSWSAPRARLARPALASAALLAVVAAAPPAGAEVLTFRFEGSVIGNNLPSGPFAGAALGDAVLVEYSFDDQAVGQPDPDLFSATYYPLLDGTITVQVDDVAVVVGAIASELDRRIALFDDLQIVGDPPSLLDGYRAFVNSPDLGGSLAMILDDEDAAAFDSESLPTSLDLADFEQTVGFITGALGGGLKFEVTGLTVVPASPAWLALGLLFAPRRRRRR